jgi:hypothetical protein
MWMKRVMVDVVEQQQFEELVVLIVRFGRVGRYSY